MRLAKFSGPVIGLCVLASGLHTAHGNYVSSAIFGVVGALWLFAVVSGALE